MDTDLRWMYGDKVTLKTYGSDDSRATKRCKPAPRTLLPNPRTAAVLFENVVDMMDTLLPVADIAPPSPRAGIIVEPVAALRSNDECSILTDPPKSGFAN